MTCIICPRSCLLQADEEDGILKVNGYKCLRGKYFAGTEMKNPVRMISSTVRTVYKDIPVLPVRVSAEIPRDRIFDVMAEINRITVDTPISKGDLIIRNVLGLGVDVIATGSCSFLPQPALTQEN